MSPRLKKFIGLFILLPSLFIYVVLAITIADFLPENAIIRIIYYAIAGVIWVFPLKPLILWMNSEPKQK